MYSSYSSELYEQDMSNFYRRKMEYHEDQMSFFVSICKRLTKFNIYARHDGDDSKTLIQEDSKSYLEKVVKTVRQGDSWVDYERIKPLNPRKIIEDIKFFCKMMKEKTGFSIEPYEFISKWGIVHMSIFLGLNDLVELLKNVENVDMKKQLFVKEGLLQLTEYKKADGFLKKSNEISFGTLPRNPPVFPSFSSYSKEWDDSKMDTSEEDDNKMDTSEDDKGMYFKKYLDTATRIENQPLIDLIEKFTYIDVHGKTVEYYPFQFGFWKDFSVEGDGYEYANFYPWERYEKWIFGCTPLHVAQFSDSINSFESILIEKDKNKKQKELADMSEKEKKRQTDRVDYIQARNLQSEIVEKWKSVMFEQQPSVDFINLMSTNTTNVFDHFSDKGFISVQKTHSGVLKKGIKNGFLNEDLHDVYKQTERILLKTLTSIIERIYEHDDDHWSRKIIKVGGEIEQLKKDFDEIHKSLGQSIQLTELTKKEGENTLLTLFKKKTPMEMRVKIQI